MTGAAAQVLAELEAHGLRIRIKGDRLALSPPSALTPELRERALAHKQELLTMLASEVGIQHGERLSCGLAIREVSGLLAVLLPELPVPATLVVDVPQLSVPVTIGTHRGCPRQTFGVDEWLAMVAHASAGATPPAVFRGWCLGRGRGQLTEVGPAGGDCGLTVARVLAALSCTLRAVVLQGGRS